MDLTIKQKKKKKHFNGLFEHNILEINACILKKFFIIILSTKRRCQILSETEKNTPQCVIFGAIYKLRSILNVGPESDIV